MQKQKTTAAKAHGAGLGGAVGAAAAIAINAKLGLDLDAEGLAGLTALTTALVAGVVTWLFAFLSPANKPKG